MGRTVARVGMDLTSAADVRVGGVSLRERRDVGEEEEIEALLLHGNNIASMLDLPSLPSLRKLDLSSNRLTKIECMEGLRALEELDLAANAIESTQGLGFLRRLRKLSLAHNRLSSLRDMAELHGADVALEEIDLRGNRLEDVDELAWLRASPSYVQACFALLPTLATVDGLDSRGQPAPGAAESLAQSHGRWGDSHSDSNGRAGQTIEGGGLGHDLSTPHLDEAIARHQARLSGARDETTLLPEDITGIKGSSNLARLERDIDRLLAAQRARAANARSARLRHHHEEAPLVRETAPLEETPAFSTTSSTAWSEDAATHENSASARAQPRDYASVEGQDVRKNDDDAHPLPRGKSSIDRPQLRSRTAADYVETLLGQELSEERSRRLQAEEAARKLMTELEQHRQRAQSGDHRLSDVMDTVRQMEEALMHTGAQVEELKRALQEAVHERTEAELMASRWQAEVEVARAQRAHEAETARHHADELAHLRQEVAQAQLAQMEQVKSLEIELAAQKGECSQYRRAAASAKKQIAQLQALLTENEARHRAECTQLVPLHGPEVQARLDEERERIEKVHAKVQAHYEAELAKAEERYKSLEEEFRTALHVEAARFSELESEFQEVYKERDYYRDAAKLYEDKGSEAAAAIQDLSHVVEEQRTKLATAGTRAEDMDRRLRETTKAAQLSDAHLKSLQRAMEKKETDLDHATAKVKAQESIIRGLREERALWSQELASQGASLAADRGRLEVEINRCHEEIEALKVKLKSSEDTVKIKDKIIDDQAQSIRALRQSVADKEREMQEGTEELRRRDANLSDRLEAERELSQQLQDDLQAALEKKSKLKSELSDAHAELEALRREYNKLKSNWQDTGVKLAQLEMGVSTMQENFDQRESDLRTQLAERSKICHQLENQLRLAQADHGSKIRERDRQQNATLSMLNQARKELEAAQRTIDEQDTELREVLTELEKAKKVHATRMARMQRVMRELQTDEIEQSDVD